MKKRFATCLILASFALSLSSCSLEDIVAKSMKDELGTRPSAVEEMAKKDSSGISLPSPTPSIGETSAVSDDASEDVPSETTAAVANPGSADFPNLIITDEDHIDIANTGYSFTLPENNVFEREDSEDFLRFAEYGSGLVMAATVPGQTNTGVVVTCFEGGLLEPTESYLDNYGGLLAEAFATDNGKADVRSTTVTISGEELYCKELHVKYEGNPSVCKTFLIGSGTDRYQVIIFDSSENGVDAYISGFSK